MKLLLEQEVDCLKMVLLFAYRDLFSYKFHYFIVKRVEFSGMHGDMFDLAICFVSWVCHNMLLNMLFNFRMIHVSLK